MRRVAPNVSIKLDFNCTRSLTWHASLLVSPKFEMGSRRSAKNNCEDRKGFQSQFTFKKKQGLEKLFEDALVDNFNRDYRSFWVAKQQQRRSKHETDLSERKGWIDVVAEYVADDGRQEKIGLEFKVCELPRSFANSPDAGTYDIGQLAWDFSELSSYNFDFG